MKGLGHNKIKSDISNFLLKKFIPSASNFKHSGLVQFSALCNDCFEIYTKQNLQNIINIS